MDRGGPADCWDRLQRAKANKWAIPGRAKTYFKTHLHQRFGEKRQLRSVLFDLYCQVGGIPVEFVEAWNEQTDVRMEVAWKPTYLRITFLSIFYTPDLAF